MGVSLCVYVETLQTAGQGFESAVSGVFESDRRVLRRTLPREMDGKSICGVGVGFRPVNLLRLLPCARGQPIEYGFRFGPVHRVLAK